MKTQKINIIEALFTIKFDKELQAILKQDIAVVKKQLAGKQNTRSIAA